VARFAGLASTYSEFRPRPPLALVELLAQMAQTARPRLVVDLGAGTGLSTRVWADAAEKVGGVEPSDDMRQMAERQTHAENVSYRAGLSHRTGLDDGCADIVTCSQSLHWMEPEATFAEAARILRPGRVFAAYDCDWPPTTPSWQADAAYSKLMDQVRALRAKHGLDADVRRWAKSDHLARMQACGRFRHTKELLLHSVEMGNAERFVGLLMSQAAVRGLLDAGLSETRIGLKAFRSVITHWLGSRLQPWYFAYRVRVGVV